MPALKQQFSGLTQAFENARGFPAIAALADFLTRNSREFRNEVHNSFQWSELLVAVRQAIVETEDNEVYTVLQSYRKVTFLANGQPLLTLDFDPIFLLEITATVFVEDTPAAPTPWGRSGNNYERRFDRLSDGIRDGALISEDVARFLAAIRRDSQTFRANYDNSPYVSVHEFMVSATEFLGGGKNATYSFEITGEGLTVKESGKVIIVLLKIGTAGFKVTVPRSDNRPSGWNPA